VHYFDPEIHRYGSKIYSQNPEDGIIEYIFKTLKISEGYFVEFGVGPPGGQTFEVAGLEANCRLLRERGWHGLFMDGHSYPAGSGVQKEFITALNINALLKRYAAPAEIDLFSIDVDGQEFWIWMNLAWQPKVVVIEYNPNFGIEISKTVPFKADFRWDASSSYYGSSLTALHQLGRSKGYTLIYANGVNAFFIRDCLVENAADFPFDKLHVSFEQYAPDPHPRAWVEI